MTRLRAWAAAGAATAAVAAGATVMMAPSGTAATQKAATECTADMMSASYTATDAAMSHRYGRIKLKNISDEACWIRGYGGLSYVGGGNGSQVGAPADRTPSPTPRTTLQPGDKVRSLVSETVAEVYPRHLCRPAKVDGFRVYIPDETHSIFIPHVTVGCQNPSVHMLDHKAYH